MQLEDMQDLCRDTITHISEAIRPGMTLIHIRSLCEEYLLAHGADSFWYWGVGALVFSGTETQISVSGKQYRTSNSNIEGNDILTIDLSPQSNNVWGDYARTLVVQDGVVCSKAENILNPEWKSGLLLEEHLHSVLAQSIRQDTSFEDVYYLINEVIAEKGYRNLDFLGNLGHTIENEKDKRIYIEKGNKKKLASVHAFTFEPHIGLKDSLFGYKRENVYRIQEGALLEL